MQIQRITVEANHLSRLITITRKGDEVKVKYHFGPLTTNGRSRTETWPQLMPRGEYAALVNRMNNFLNNGEGNEDIGVVSDQMFFVTER